MLEQGVVIAFIQIFLGHNDIRTTTRYTHISEKNLRLISNPLDNILFGPKKS
ncbi:MAG: hypothetical protein HY738_09805 [Bacteroidia bacterium]|nr:hypothetical protein [Bacteroidia bacterium]